MSQRERKLAALTSASRYDVSSPGECADALGSSRPAVCGPLFKVLLHGGCSYDCGYCALRLRRERYAFAPAELAETFLRLHREGRAGGLFLSSGIPRDVDLVMHGIVETGEILRERGFCGYLHLKILPGAARSDIEDAARVADRISINLEAPSHDRLSLIAGVKDYRNDILKRQRWVSEAKPGRHTTQLVVGAADERDDEIFRCVCDQYRTVAPARIYYSAFRALPGTPLEGREDTPAWRARRWYQADFLLRQYRFTEDELRAAFDVEGRILNRDVKELLAEGRSAVDINTAPYHELIRVPGIGPRGAARIIRARKERPLCSAADLRKAGIRSRKAETGIVIGGTVQTELSGY
ncbi:hypothetical protein ASZ90_010504 [hydrocarbon metagenome]|uniref:Radical SAM core domain-containing protein n=1 Tax=hydrocarbon metagenome TaxID=938273 RepID=A0A0W8FFZ3_9ZZZZ|nr:helix-hairpin-helix domain-containing protein [Methanomicrobiaceae archaeon]